VPFPKITYVSGGTQTLTFVRGPQNFACDWTPRVHDNLSTSGAARERVVEGMDLIISFGMANHIVQDDLPGWELFMAFALAGGSFKFFPDSTNAEYYNCCEESGEWNLRLNAPKKYGASYKFRILKDAQTPAGPSTVMRRFYGL
jgi:hypothetical protein